jgi:O-antigen biosynthesis protein
VVAKSKGALLFVTGVPLALAQRTVEILSGRRLKLPGNLASKCHYGVPPSLAETIAAEATRLVPTKSRKELTARGEIRVSIVIPVFNKAEFTLNCLHSLLKEIDLRRTQIIVVDNASTDRTAEILSQFSDLIRVISNEENRGFVDACNQGAAAARGEFLVFLNNDTEVLPGWLNPLEETAEQRPSVGAVGSLLLYPDNSIQEAGAIVWRNGEAHHYGWGGSPDDRRFNFAREVDYCSAASLLIRKNVFNELGGFDRRFAPAYYEDVDLCFGVRSLGYKVMYQPASRLVHYEGVTAGADTSKGIKQFQIVNREKFVAKWREVLEHDQLPKKLERLTEASDRNRDWPRIIVFDERIPTPDRDAGSLRMFLILKTLAKWSHVIFVPMNRPKEDDYERALWKEGIETADAVDYRRLLRNKNVKTAIVSRPGPAAALIHRIRRTNPRVRVVFDMVDTHFVRLQREYEVSRNAHARTEAQRYRKLESRLARASDLVWCASPEDKEVMEREVPGSRIEVVSTIHELRDGGKPFVDRQDLLFIGNLAHRPNEDAILFFIRGIYPRIRQAFPNMRLDIIGDNPSPEIIAYNSEEVRVRGYVPDVGPFLRERRVFVAPLRFGAGIKGKIGESMSYGLPVVTTTMGAEGFGLVNAHNAMIADTPEDFAAAVARLYSEKELWQMLAANSQQHIKKNFTPDVIAETINASINQVSG